MAVSAFEGIVESGRIRLRDDVKLSDDARVYVIIPDFEPAPRVHVHSPHLTHPEQAADFAKQIVEFVGDAQS